MDALDITDVCVYYNSSQTVKGLEEGMPFTNSHRAVGSGAGVAEAAGSQLPHVLDNTEDPEPRENEGGSGAGGAECGSGRSRGPAVLSVLYLLLLVLPRVPSASGY